MYSYLTRNILKKTLSPTHYVTIPTVRHVVIMIHQHTYATEAQVGRPTPDQEQEILANLKTELLERYEKTYKLVELATKLEQAPGFMKAVNKLNATLTEIGIAKDEIINLYFNLSKILTDTDVKAQLEQIDMDTDVKAKLEQIANAMKTYGITEFDMNLIAEHFAEERERNANNQ